MMLAKLKEVMDQLPIQTINGKDYKPVFRFGTEDDLNKFLKVKRRGGGRHYPLVWLETPVEEGIDTTFTLILATVNKRTDMGNVDRLDWTMTDTLVPLERNVMHALKRSRAFKMTADQWVTNNYSGTKIFNYTMTPDIWDAIRMEVGVRFLKDCKVKQIHF